MIHCEIRFLLCSSLFPLLLLLCWRNLREVMNRDHYHMLIFFTTCLTSLGTSLIWMLHKQMINHLHKYQDLTGHMELLCGETNVRICLLWLSLASIIQGIMLVYKPLELIKTNCVLHFIQSSCSISHRYHPIVGMG